MGYRAAPVNKDAYLFANLKGKPCEVSGKLLSYKFICRDFPAIDLFEGIENALFQA
jgi:hypothetical protein